MVEVRDLKNGGVDQLVALFEAVLPGFEATVTPHFVGPALFVQDPASFALGAYVDDEPAGLAWGMQMRSPGGRLTTYLHELNVREEWRRHGVGTALVHEAMSLGRRNGSTRFWLSTGGHNLIAQAMYQSLGGDRKELGDVNYWWELDEPERT